jgi:hypothetical protein
MWKVSNLAPLGAPRTCPTGWGLERRQPDACPGSDASQNIPKVCERAMGTIHVRLEWRMEPFNNKPSGWAVTDSTCQLPVDSSPSRLPISKVIHLIQQCALLALLRKRPRENLLRTPYRNTDQTPTTASPPSLLRISLPCRGTEDQMEIDHAAAIGTGAALNTTRSPLQCRRFPLTLLVPKRPQASVWYPFTPRFSRSR